jgi:hypothetical protein
MRLSNILAGAVMAAASLVAASEASATIVYTAHDALGTAGLVTGTITTDGVLGALGSGDFVSWDLTLNDGTTTATLTNLNSILFINGNVTAAATALQFDFNGDGELMNFFSSSACSTEWSFETTGSGTGCNGTSGNEEGVLASGTLQASPESGEVTFATAGGVPEPATWVAMLLGFVGLGAAMRSSRRKPSAVVA